MKTPNKISKILNGASLEIRPKPKYNYIRFNSYKKLAHRVIWEIYNGPIPEGMIIHHINGDKKDNRIDNLKMVSFIEHMVLHRKANKFYTPTFNTEQIII